MTLSAAGDNWENNRQAVARCDNRKGPALPNCGKFFNQSDAGVLRLVLLAVGDEITTKLVSTVCLLFAAAGTWR